MSPANAEALQPSLRVLEKSYVKATHILRCSWWKYKMLEKTTNNIKSVRWDKHLRSDIEKNLSSLVDGRRESPASVTAFE